MLPLCSVKSTPCSYLGWLMKIFQLLVSPRACENEVETYVSSDKSTAIFMLRSFIGLSSKRILKKIFSP